MYIRNETLVGQIHFHPPTFNIPRKRNERPCKIPLSFLWKKCRFGFKVWDKTTCTTTALQQHEILSNISRRWTLKGLISPTSSCLDWHLKWRYFEIHVAQKDANCQFIYSNNSVAVVTALRLREKKKKTSTQRCGCIMTPSAGPQTHQRCVSALTLPSPRLPAHSRALVITFSPPPPPAPTPLSVLFHLPPKPPRRHLGFPPSCAPHLSPHPRWHPSHPPPLPLAPLSPISVSVCSYPADLCPSCRCWFAHPAPLANMTKRDPQYSNRHAAFKCRMAGSTWVQL